MAEIGSKLPPGLVRYKATSAFTRDTVPKALLAAHSLKAGVWGLLHVLGGRVRYHLDDGTSGEAIVATGATVVIEPEASHHVELLDADSSFLVEFYRAEAT